MVGELLGRTGLVQQTTVESMEATDSVERNLTALVQEFARLKNNLQTFRTGH